MDPITILIIGSIAGGLIGGVRAYNEHQQRKKEADALNDQAKVIEEQLIKVQEYVTNNQYSEESIKQAYERIAKIYDSAGDEFKAAMQTGVNDSIRVLQEQNEIEVEDLNDQLSKFNDVMSKESKAYRSQWQEGMDKMRTTLANRRLLSSQFGAYLNEKGRGQLLAKQEAEGEQRKDIQKTFAKQKERMSNQLASNIKSIKAQASSQLGQMLANLAIQKGTQQENKTSQMEMFNKQLGQFGFGQGLELEREASALRGQAKVTDPSGQGLATILGGTFGGLFGGLNTASNILNATK